MNELDESLERVDQHIVLAFKRVEEQRNRVLELRRRGEDDTFSHQKLLATLIYSLMIYQQRRKDLLEFAAAKATERETSGSTSEWTLA